MECACVGVLSIIELKNARWNIEIQLTVWQVVKLRVEKQVTSTKWNAFLHMGYFTNSRKLLQTLRDIGANELSTNGKKN